MCEQMIELSMIFAKEPLSNIKGSIFVETKAHRGDCYLRLHCFFASKEIKAITVGWHNDVMRLVDWSTIAMVIMDEASQIWEGYAGSHAFRSSRT